MSVVQGELDLDSLGGWLTASIQQYGTAQYLRDLSHNALRGMVTAAKTGKALGIPYGYKRGGDGMVIDPDKAPVVRRIFQEFTSEGQSLRANASGLTADGIPSPAGLAWRKNGVAAVLKRRAYVGDYVWGERPQGKFHTMAASGIEARNGHRPVAAPIVLADHHEPLVDRATFALAQERLGFNRKQTSPHNRTGGGYLLTGLLRCGCCGSAMGGQQREGQPRYRCCGYHDGGRAKCSNNHVGEASLVAALVEKIRREYLSPANLDALRADIRQQQQTDAKPADASTLYARLEKLQAERDTLRTALDAAQRPATASDPRPSKRRRRL